MSETKIKILLVEDDEVNQMAFERFIKENEMPYDYMIASSISESKEILNKNNFDVIVADYMLGDGNAFELLEMQLDTPIIISTKSGSEEVAVNAMKMGAHDYIIKDIEYDYLKIMPLAIQKSIKQKQNKDHIEMLTHTIAQISDSVLILNISNEIIYINDAFCKTYGYQADELLGKKVKSVLGWEDPLKLSDCEKKRVSHGSLIHNLYHQHKDGHCFPVSVSKSVLQKGQGKEEITVYVIRDISDYIKAEENHLMALFSEWSPAPLVRVDEKCRIIMANKEANNVFGFESLTGISINNLIKDFDEIEPSQCIKNNCLKNIYAIQIGEKTYDFAIRGISELSVMQIYGFDVTEKTRLQNELLKKEKLAAIGQTIASITHCMKNIFTVLKGGNYLLKESIEKDDKIKQKKSYEVLSRAINNLYLLLMNMLDYSKKQTPVRSKVEIRVLFSDINEALKYSAELNKVTIKNIIDENSREHNLDYQLIYRALLNLGCNAIEAMQDGGELKFLAYKIKKTDWENMYPDFIIGDWDCNELFILEVSDTGCGIPKDNLENIFNPFFSTKGSKGTGLGLATVKQFIESGNDKIFVKSQEDNGTSFYLVFK